jgi:hypothetical protein
LLGAIIEEAEHPDYEGQAGHALREKAEGLRVRAEAVFKEKDACFNRGDKAGGRAKLAEGKAHQQQMHEANDKAALEIFAHRNKGRGELYMDFHGLYKNEALKLIQDRLTSLAVGTSVPLGHGNRQLELVPGAGKHSGVGGAVLKPAIEQLLRERGLKYEMKNAGDLLVTI